MYRRAKLFAAAVFISIITAYGSVAALAQRSRAGRIKRRIVDRIGWSSRRK